MKFIHAKEIIETYPNNFTGVFTVKNLKQMDFLLSKKESLSDAIKDNGISENSKSKILNWKEVYKIMNAKPKYISSLESLVNFYIDKNDLYKINSLVDFYNYYSITCGCPMAAYNMDKFDGDLLLKLPGKGASFTPLGSPKITQPTKPKEVAYVDDSKVICRYWNLQDCDQTKITDDTTNVLFIFDIYAENSDDATKEFECICEYFKETFNGYEISYGITGNNLEQELTL